MSNLKDKMYNYEVIPPANVWDRIAIEIEESELAKNYPKKLYDLQATPPPAIWEKIDVALNSEIVPVSKPVIRKLSPYVRYAAAAMLIGVIAFIVIRFTVGGNNGPEDAQAQNGSPDTLKPGNSNLPISTETATAGTGLTDDDKALEESKKLVASLDRPGKRLSGKLSAYDKKDQLTYTDYIDPELVKSIYAYEDHVPSIADRYVMLMTPDGNIIRMSKKWGDLLCCVSGEEQDQGCKDQLKKWQEKIASSPLAPSPGNFMDILGLVNSLSENSEL